MTEEVLFHAVLAQPEAQRVAYLAEHCPDPDLRKRVEALLAAQAAGGPLDQSATGAFVPGPGASEPPPAAPEGTGTRVGPYKLLQPIGEGGMGAVWMAEQEQPVRRRVALKLIKPGMDTAQVIARFEAERQALALMDHQNIARVLDAGTTAAGRPYFVMELVKGVPITKYCDEARLTPRERLELFIPVCQAVQHAHQKGIIHRDLKPSNVLVTLYDGRPVPKVIDFGVAKALHQRLTERTMFTEFGAVVGTFEYMAPEQAELSALDVDTRADVYALGVLLYELLTGTTPFDRKRLRSAAFAEVLRIIREEEPPKPSTRISTAEELPSIAAVRRTEPRQLGRLVRGELDWIVMRALEKDRSRRYETANGFAKDIQRYLADEAVEACPPSTAYRLRKFARRYKAPLVVAAGFAALLAVAAAVSSWQAWRATRAEAVAVEARNDVERVNEHLTRSRDDLEVTLARSLSRPFLEKGGDLTEPEAEALWELARNPGEKLWLRFVDEGTRTPEAAARFRERSELAWIAAVGLDPAKRERVERLLGERLSDPRIAPRQKIDLAFAAIELTAPGSPLSRQCADVLGNVPTNVVRRMTEERTAEERWSDRLLFDRTERLDAHDAARLLSNALRTEADEGVRGSLAITLAAVAERLDPADAARTCGPAARIIADALTREDLGGYWRGHLAKGLAAVAGRIDPADAARTCGPAARLLAGDVGRQTNYLERREVAQGLAAVAGRLSPAAPARVCGPTARMLADALKSERDAKNRQHLAAELAAVAEWLPPADAAKLLGTALENEPEDDARYCLTFGLMAVARRLDPAEAARLFGDALQRESKPYVRRQLAEGLAAAAKRLPPSEAARACGPAAQLLADALQGEDRCFLGKGLAALVDRLAPADAARVCVPAAQRLAASLEQRTDESFRRLYAESLAAVVMHIDAADAVPICRKAIQSIRQALASDPTTLSKLFYYQAMASLLGSIDPEEARQIARDMANWIGSATMSYYSAAGLAFDEVLDCALSETPHSQDWRQKTVIKPASARETTTGVPTMPARQPPTCWLTTQELVELLKMPTCYGEARKVVLKHLGNRYRREFRDHWEFVEYARSHNLNLDFTTPPVRHRPPEAAAR
jgi:serine/threonine protein kinase